MKNSGRFNLGIAGACGRGRRFRTACEALACVDIRAVCDLNEEGLDAAAEELGASEKYTDYETMLESSDLDAVIIGTPMHLHVPQAIMALERNLHVMSEVPAGVSVEECQELVKACAASPAFYMMAENYTYTRPNVLVRELVRQGLFGTPYYAEGEYLHELKELNEITRWRRKWQTGIPGITYGSHSLGPILQWMPGDRVARVCCAGSGHHYRDARGNKYENDDSTVMLCQMKNGGLVKIRLDMLSDRPHSMTNYQIQGTDGAYESARVRGGINRIWLRAKCKDISRWMDLRELEEEYLPASWKKEAGSAAGSGHGGGDYFVVAEFVSALRTKQQPPIGIHEAMDMTLPGLISQRSIREGGAWCDVPDSRTWTPEQRWPQLRMIWPEAKLSSPPEPKVPEGYRLRQYRESDEEQYLALMTRAGFTGWNRDRLRQCCVRVLPGGFFVIEDIAGGRLAATAMALHNPRELHPFGGELGWVAADPDHRGKGLGAAVTAAATARFIRAGYRNIYLRTDDFRLPAIATYLKVGYQPLIFCEGMAGRWEELRKKLA